MGAPAEPRDGRRPFPRDALVAHRGGARPAGAAHFEVWPTLGATVAIAFALVGYGLLRRHWRLAGMDRPAPERRLPGARRLQRLGIFLFVMFLVREALARAGAIAVASYIPVIGAA